MEINKTIQYEIGDSIRFLEPYPELPIELIGLEYISKLFFHQSDNICMKNIE